MNHEHGICEAGGEAGRGTDDGRGSLYQQAEEERIYGSIGRILGEAEFRYDGLRFIFHQWYIISHLPTSVMVLLVRKFLLRLQKDITVREKVVLTLMFYGLMVLLIGMPANPTGHTFLSKIGMVAGIMILALEMHWTMP